MNTDIFKTKDQMYGKVIKLYGDSRAKILCEDGIERNCRIRGAIKRRIRLKKDDVVLVSLREFEEDKADIIHKYSLKEIKILIKSGDLKKKDLISQEKKQENETDTSLDIDNI